jgi:flavin-binding protein dodecin
MSKTTESPNSVYRVTEAIGMSTKSWEDAAESAVETAARTLRDLRVAEVVKTDLKVKGGNGAVHRIFQAVVLTSFSLNNGIGLDQLPSFVQ